MASTEQCVPLESLAMPEEGEQMANPEVGDVVSYTVEGKVTRIEGGKAYVEPTAINGKPMSEKEEPAGDGMADLERAAGETGYLG
jgi:hypothetical protein